MQRRQPRIILRVRTGAVPQQQINRERVALVCSPHQRRVPLRVAAVDIERLVQQIQQRHDRRGVRHQVQRIIPLRITDIWVGVVRNQQLDDVEVAVARSPLHGRSDEVATECIDLGACLQQVAAGGELGIDGSPVQRCNVLLVAVRGFCAPGLDERADEMDVAALSCDEDVCLARNG